MSDKKAAKAKPAPEPVDYSEHERHELLTGEARYSEDEIRNSKFALVFGALAGIFLIVSMILCWILYHRERCRTFMWHGIILIFLILFAFACAGWGAMAGSAVKVGREPAPAFTTIVFLFSLFAIGFLLIESIWWIMYRPLHRDYLTGLKADPQAWDDHMVDGSTLENGWKQSRRLMWWTVFFNVAAAVCFILIAYAARSITWNRYNLTRLTLYIALAVAVLAAWLMIYWIEEAKEYEKALPGEFAGNLLCVLKVLAILVLVFAGLLAIINLIQSKVGYFILGALTIILAIVLVCAAGSLLRQTYKASHKGIYQKGGCAATMGSIHENDLSDLCPTGGKYVDPNQSNSKYELASRWEGDGEIKALNPTCCPKAKSFYLRSFMLLGYWSLVCIFCLAIAIGCAFYLAETNEYLSSSNGKIGPIDFAGLALVFLTMIGLGIYFWARKANKLENNPNNSYRSFKNPETNKIEGFDLVPESLKNRVTDDAPAHAQASSPNCIAYNVKGSPFTTFSTDASKTSCTDASKCSERLAILIEDATFSYKLPHSSESQVQQGSLEHKNVFFPGCKADNQEYAFFYGSNAQIRELLENMNFCPKTNNADIKYWIYHDQVETDKIKDNQGHLESENNSHLQGSTTTTTTTTTTTNQPAAPAAPVCGAGFAAADSCTGTCKIANKLTRPNSDFILKGRLFKLINGNQDYNIHSAVKGKISAFGKPMNSDFILFENGLFLFKNIFVSKQKDYIITLDIEDPKHVYLSKSVDILVSRHTSDNKEISAGDIRLLSKNGQFCGEDDNNCKNGQPMKKGDIIASVKNITTLDDEPGLESLVGADVTLSKGHNLASEVFARAKSDNTGNFRFKGYNYDSYTVKATKSGFRPSVAFVDLQSDNEVKTLELRPTLDEYDMRIQFANQNPNVDFDLITHVKSDQGNECYISPYNKFCGYGAHKKDVILQKGTEDIAINKLAIANYASFVQPSPDYGNVCPAGTQADQDPYKCRSEPHSWSWDRVKGSTPLSRLSYTSSTSSKNYKIYTDSENRELSLLQDLAPVESKDEARSEKKVISVNGEARPASIPEKMSTAAEGKRLLQVNPNAGGSFIWISCFNGWGADSVLELNDLADKAPTADDCGRLIQDKWSDKTLSNLRQKAKQISEDYE